MDFVQLRAEEENHKKWDTSGKHVDAVRIAELRCLGGWVVKQERGDKKWRYQR